MYDWAEFRHFSYILKILEKGGFRIAAEELHTSQPNLTVQARRFQDHASVCLFRRVIDALVAIERGEVGVVRLGSTPLVDQNLFRSFCALHKELLPRVHRPRRLRSVMVRA
jgi:hypothetical protein